MRPVNEKNLNYEIETEKPPVRQISRRPVNEKNLNYEIETGLDLPLDACRRSGKPL